MILHICVENSMGMSFNRRRVSRDSVVISRIAENAGDSAIFMNERSAMLFEGKNVNLCADFLEKAGEGQHVFAETDDVSPFSSKIEKIYLYKWNRDYPSDLKLTLDLSKYRLESSEEYPGSSHELITEEVYSL